MCRCLKLLPGCKTNTPAILSQWHRLQRTVSILQRPCQASACKGSKLYQSFLELDFRPDHLYTSQKPRVCLKPSSSTLKTVSNRVWFIELSTLPWFPSLLLSWHGKTLRVNTNCVSASVIHFPPREYKTLHPLCFWGNIIIWLNLHELNDILSEAFANWTCIQEYGSLPNPGRPSTHSAALESGKLRNQTSPGCSGSADMNFPGPQFRAMAAWVKGVSSYFGYWLAIKTICKKTIRYIVQKKTTPHGLEEPRSPNVPRHSPFLKTLLASGSGDFYEVIVLFVHANDLMWVPRRQGSWSK